MITERNITILFFILWLIFTEVIFICVVKSNKDRKYKYWFLDKLGAILYGALPAMIISSIVYTAKDLDLIELKNNTISLVQSISLILFGLYFFFYGNWLLKEYIINRNKREVNK